MYSTIYKNMKHDIIDVGDFVTTFGENKQHFNFHVLRLAS